MLWTQLPDTLDVSALSLVLSIARGPAFDKREAALAAFNGVGYAANQGLPASSGKMMMGTAPDAEYTDAEVDEAFGKIIASNGTFAATPETMQANGKYLQIIVSLALKILPLILAA